MTCPHCQTGFVFELKQEVRCVNCGWYDYNHEVAFIQTRVLYQPREDKQHE